MAKDGDQRPCPHKTEDGKQCEGQQTFNRYTKPPGYRTYNPPNTQAGWLCNENREHFDAL